MPSLAEAPRHLRPLLDFANSPESAHLRDVALVCGGRAFRCHSIILQAHSPWLAGPLAERQGDDGPIVVVVEGAGPEAVESALAFAYSGVWGEADEATAADGALALGLEARPVGKKRSVEAWPVPTAPKKEAGSSGDEGEAVEGVDDRRLKCCDEEFDQEVLYAAHKENVHSEGPGGDRFLICCGEKNFGAGTFGAHLQQSHRWEGDGGRAECCDQQLSGLSQLARHCSDTHGLTLATFRRILCCSKRITTPEEYERHKEESEHVECHRCAFLSRDERRLSLHLSAKHKEPRSGGYGCKSCPRTFKTSSARRKHANSHPGAEGGGRVGGGVQCEHCGKLFPSAERRRVHERFVHVVERRAVACDLCQKEFANRERMSDHRRSVHKERKFQCEACGSTFKNSSALKSHTVSLHLEHDAKPLRCADCGKGFIHVSRLRAHQITHSDVTRFACSFCGRPNKCKSNNLKHEKRCKKRAAAESGSEQERRRKLMAESVQRELNQQWAEVTGQGATAKENVP